MKSIFIIATVFLFGILACTDKHEEPDCSKLRSGEFEYRGGANKRIINIQRNDSIQTETDKGARVSMTFKIEWKGDCEYSLKALSFSRNGKDSAIDLSRIPTLTTSIKKVTRGYYTCESGFEGNNMLQADTMIILKL